MRSHLLLLAALLASPMASAGVIIVDGAGGGDFTTLTAAVAAGVDGDTILIRDGTYVEAGPVIVDGKSLTIAGEWVASVFELAVVVQPGLLIRNLPATKTVVLQNLVLLGASSTATAPAMSGLILRDNVSHVRVQACVVAGGEGASNASPDGAAAVDALNSASTAFVGCTVTGGEGQFSWNLGVVSGDGGAGFVSAAGQLLLYDCFVNGGYGGGNIVGGWPDGGNGGTGVQHSSGSLFLVGTSARGGDGGTSHFGGDGGIGLSMGFSGVGWLLGGSFASGGDGGWSDDGPDGTDGLDIDDPSGLVTDFGGTLHGFDLTSPVREGEVGMLRLGGDVNDAALVFLSPLLHQLPFPGYQGFLMLMPATMLGPFILGPPGNVDVPFLVPFVDPSLQALSVHVQPAYAGPDGVVLGPARVLTVLDAAF